MWISMRMMRVSPWDNYPIIVVNQLSCCLGDEEEATEPPPAAEETPTEVSQ